MAYKALDEKSLLDYIKSRPSIQEAFSPNVDFSVQEVGDGNLNLVFIVKNLLFRYTNYLKMNSYKYFIYKCFYCKNYQITCSSVMIGLDYFII